MKTGQNTLKKLDFLDLQRQADGALQNRARGVEVRREPYTTASEGTDNAMRLQVPEQGI